MIRNTKRDLGLKSVPRSFEEKSNQTKKVRACRQIWSGPSAENYTEQDLAIKRDEKRKYIHGLLKTKRENELQALATTSLKDLIK
jgi:hypothetical protein